MVDDGVGVSEQERVPADGLADRLAAKVAEPWSSPKLG